MGTAAAVPIARACQWIAFAFWRERRAGRCEAPRRRRCRNIVEERQQSRCPPAAAPLRAAAASPLAALLAPYILPGILVARALPAGLGATAKCKRYSLTDPNFEMEGRQWVRSCEV